MTNASQSWNKIADMISESHQVLEQGGLVDLTDLNQQVAIACESANSLTADERQQVLTQMQEVVAALDDLETLIASLQGDQITGVRLIQNALKEPLRQIATNAGANGDVVLAEIRRHGKGFNALTGTYEDLLSAGILDPAKVVRLALQDAASIASLILTTEAIIADRPEPPSPPSGGDGMGGMGGMGGMMGGMGGMGGMGMPGMGMM